MRSAVNGNHRAMLRRRVLSLTEGSFPLRAEEPIGAVKTRRVTDGRFTAVSRLRIIAGHGTGQDPVAPTRRAREGAARDARAESGGACRAGRHEPEAPGRD